ncbi:heme-binding protein [Mesorhizobium sp. M1227]|uniref:heme-binding protein n=1 Tax=Mesorhizobium sp. M1227 TaxID=2957071 RepID=UPI00333938DA
MPIETNFKFQQLHPAGEQPHALPPDFLGLLRGFVGAPKADGKAQRTWTGSGFNMIWRPNFGNEFGPTDFFLELNFTDETLDFNDISGPTGIANRGLLQEGIFLGGVAYLQTINDSFDNSGQHFEPGVWNNVPQTTDPSEPATVVRMGTIPHGTTINLQGRAFEVAQPQFQSASITPFTIGSADDAATNLIHFPEEILTNVTESRTPLANVAGLTQQQLTDPNIFLSQAIAGQTITRTVVIQVSSDSTPAGSVPDAGGGTDNTAFLVGKPPSGPNAHAPTVTSTFWIEEGTDAQGLPLLQLQYTQRVLLNFNGLSWPHITVATLRPL